MKIACLGWGSLVWDPDTLPLRGPWFPDGPFLPIEFARQSKDGRITLVIVRNRAVPPVRSLWAMMDTNDISHAKEALCEREGIPETKIDQLIGCWIKGREINREDNIVFTISSWAERMGLDAVIWTDLPPKFNNENDRVPTIEEVLNYLSSLDPAKRKKAEQYIRMTPVQVDTDYRRKIIEKLNWVARQ